jgi:outer membrane translocation and assembly module TamA
MRGWDVLRFKKDNNKPIGEIIRFMTNIEYRFPIYKMIGFTLFVDGGILTNHTVNVSAKIIKWDSGFGVTIQTPLGPARIDYAVQINEPNNRKIQLGIQYLF